MFITLLVFVVCEWTFDPKCIHSADKRFVDLTVAGCVAVCLSCSLDSLFLSKVPCFLLLSLYSIKLVHVDQPFNP